MPKRHSADTVYTVYNIVTSACFALAFTVNMVYFYTQVGLNPLQMVLVGTALETSILLFEIPTGVVADTLSRRKSIIIGVFLLGIGTLFFALIPSFPVIILSQVIWGLGYTFTSGALEAWISDEIGEENAGAIFLKGTRVSQYGGLVAIPASVVLAQGQLTTPIYVSVMIFWLLGLYLILFMPETGFQPVARGDRSRLQQMTDTLRSGGRMLRLRPALISILFIGLFFGLYSEGYDRLWEARILDQFTFPDIPGLQMITWFGIIDMVSQLLTILAVSPIEKRADTNKLPTLIRWLTILSTALVLSLLVFALAGSLWLAVAAVLAIGVLRAVIWPLYLAWINHRLDSSVRATILSMSGQVDSIGQIASGPIMGAVANRFGIRYGLIGSVLLLIPVIPLLITQLRNREEGALSAVAPGSHD